MTPEPREVLAPCPFCGGTARKLRGLPSEGDLVGCAGKCASVEVALEDWNCRPPSRLREVARRVAGEMKAKVREEAEGGYYSVIESAVLDWASELESAAGGEG